jgi:hypothetical protein
MDVGDYMLLNCVCKGILSLIKLVAFVVIVIPVKIIKGIYKCATKNKKQRNNESRDYSTSSSSSRDSDRSVSRDSDRSVQSERSTSTISDISNRARRRSSIRNAGLSVQNNQRRSVMQVAAL